MPRSPAAAAFATQLAPAHPAPARDDLVAQVAGLHAGFTRNGPAIEAARGVDLEIGRGEIVGLVGESGSGKSVLSLALLGLLPEASQPRTSGLARVAGTDVLSATPEVRRQVRKISMGAVFQDPMTSLNPTMKVGRQVAEVAGSVPEALRLLQAVGIPEPERRLDSYP